MSTSLLSADGCNDNDDKAEVEGSTAAAAAAGSGCRATDNKDNRCKASLFEIKAVDGGPAGPAMAGPDHFLCRACNCNIVFLPRDATQSAVLSRQVVLLHVCTFVCNLEVSRPH